MKFNGIKANGKTYDIWATSAEVKELNNVGNAEIGKELESGKQAIASAIVAKGGEASATESLAELAQDITNIEELQDWQKMVCERTYSSASGADSPIRNITKLDSPNVNSVGAYAFYGCTNLREVNLSNVEILEERAFQGCTNLQEVNLPNATSAIDRVFAGCTNLKVVSLENCAIGADSSVFAINNWNVKFLKIKSFRKGSFSSATYQTLSNLLKLETLEIEQVITGLDDSQRTTSETYKTPMLIKFVINEIFDMNFNCTIWTASTYLTSSAEQWENRLKLYENLRDYTISALYDHSADGVTRTFRLGFYATLYADSQLTTEPYGSYYTPLIKQAAQDCIRIVGEKHWAISA